MTTTAPQTLNVYVVPCGASKQDTPAPARDLYTGAHFQYVLHRTITEAALDTAQTGAATRVMILSARHGLVDLDTVLAPYDTRMSDPGSVPAEYLAVQLWELTAAGQHVEVYGMLPAAYRDRLTAAAQVINDLPDQAPGALPYNLLVHDVYEGAGGIGYQRGIAARIGS